MDRDALAFVLDRIDVARISILEAIQTTEKFSQPEDSDIANMLREMLDRANRLEQEIRSGSHSGR